MVDCPDIVKQSNGAMGGVDLADMLKSLYRTPWKLVLASSCTLRGHLQG